MIVSSFDDGKKTAEQTRPACLGERRSETSAGHDDDDVYDHDDDDDENATWHPVATPLSVGQAFPRRVPRPKDPFGVARGVCLTNTQSAWVPSFRVTVQFVYFVFNSLVVYRPW